MIEVVSRRGACYNVGVMRSLVPLVFLVAAARLAAQDVSIHAVQGTGRVSPLAGQTVSVNGVVTAVKSNGFFVQSADGAADTNPATSEGIFVFTSSAPGVARGQQVRVRGRVTEFRPNDPLSSELTELTSPSIDILGTLQAMPAAVRIEPSREGGVDQLERYEGMRVTIRDVAVVAATEAARDERNGTATSRGVFYVAPASLARPFAEPGVDIRLALPATAPCCVPRFDANPERVRVDSDGQTGVAAADVAAGVRIPEITGVLDYSSHDYTILPDTAIASATSTPDALEPAAGGQTRVATFNLLRLYDDRDDPSTGDTVLSTAALDRRLRKLTRAIIDLLASPDVIGVQEVEDVSVLTTLADRVRAATGGTVDYAVFSIAGNDPSALNVGILARRGRVSLSNVRQMGKDATFIDPRDGSVDLLFDRPPLVANVEGGALRFTLIVNHLRSLNDIETNPFVRAKRAGQAEYIARFADERQRVAERVVIIGDLNARPHNDGWVDVIGTIVGRPAQPTEVLHATSDLVADDLVRLSPPPALDYTFVHEGNAESLDHVIVSGALLPHVRRMEVAHINADFPDVEAASESATRTSDHDVPVVTLSEAVPARKRTVRR